MEFNLDLNERPEGGESTSIYTNLIHIIPARQTINARNYTSDQFNPNH